MPYRESPSPHPINFADKLRQLREARSSNNPHALDGYRNKIKEVQNILAGRDDSGEAFFYGGFWTMQNFSDLLKELGEETN